VITLQVLRDQLEIQLLDFQVLQVLKVLCENTPKAVFPKRKIARIAEGYEASFIVVAENPLQNVLRARVADFRLKQGTFVR
jgi:hypothetical protein